MKDRHRFPLAVLSALLMSLSAVTVHAAAADGAAAAPPTPVAQFKVFKIGGYRAVALKDGVATGQRLYSEHFPFPGIGKIVKTKDGTFWQPESLH
jgi:hypothetical protein